MAINFTPFEVDRPTGPPLGTLLCLPGLNSGAYLFAPVQHHLPGWQVVRFATPGVEGVPLPLPFTAKSYAAWVLAQLKNLGSLASPAVVLGHSLGGYAAQELARLMGPQINRLILVSTSRGQPDTANDLAQMEKRMGQSFWHYMKALEEEPERGMLALFGPSWPVQNPKAYQAFLVQRAAALPPKTATLAQLTAGGMFCSVRWVHRLTLPTLVIHGTDDVLISHQSGQALAASLPAGRLLSLHGVGHFPMLEHANFWAYVADFTQGTMLGETVRQKLGWRQWLRDLWERQG